MATSSKVMFNLDKLREEATKSIDERIRDAELHVASFDDEEALRQLIAEWRVRQEDRIRELAKSLDVAESTVGDYQLAKWKIEPIPELDRYGKDRAEQRLRGLVAAKSRIEAKAGSLVADENGNISLTKTQLDEFFGL